MYTTKSHILELKPTSLSYQATIFAVVEFNMTVASTSIILEKCVER